MGYRCGCSHLPKVCGGCDVGVFRGPSGTRQWRLWVFLTTRGPQPGFHFFFCLHGPASPSFLPPSGAIPCCTTPARLTVWGYVGKFCVSCVSLGGLVNNHTFHGMFRHKAPCRVSLGAQPRVSLPLIFRLVKSPQLHPYFPISHSSVRGRGRVLPSHLH